MKSLDEILGELARKSYQNKKETASYLPLVAEAKLAILEVVRGKIESLKQPYSKDFCSCEEPYKKENYMICQKCGKLLREFHAYNQAVDDINSKIGLL
jgi:hypothetical protein